MYQIGVMFLFLKGHLKDVIVVQLLGYELPDSANKVDCLIKHIMA